MITWKSNKEETKANLESEYEHVKENGVRRDTTWMKISSKIMVWLHTRNTQSC